MDGAGMGQGRGRGTSPARRPSSWNSGQETADWRASPGWIFLQAPLH